MSESTVTISIDQLVTLAVEHWRLSNELPIPRPPSVNHAIRKIGDVLVACEIETRVLDGQPYDPGLSARVIDTLVDESLSDSTAMIVQTVCPMVLHRGNVVRSTDIVIAQKSAQ